MNHATWDKLGHKGLNDRSKEDWLNYSLRITKEFPNIPPEVLQQWIYAHHSDSRMEKNYGWIDYNKVKFSLKAWPTKNVLKINECEDFAGAVESHAETAKSSNIESFMRPEDLNYWKINGTWKTPIVVIETKKIFYPHVRFKKPFQLIEGHTRLGRLKTFVNNSSKLAIAKIHKIWLMQII